MIKSKKSKWTKPEKPPTCGGMWMTGTGCGTCVKCIGQRAQSPYAIDKTPGDGRSEDFYTATDFDGVFQHGKTPMEAIQNLNKIKKGN